MKAYDYHLGRLEGRRLACKRGEAPTFFTVMTTRVDFSVSITLSGESPYKIFKSLNSTGVDLEQGDLIRNHVFMALPVADQDTFDDEHWRPLERHFDKDGKLDGQLVCGVLPGRAHARGFVCWRERHLRGVREAVSAREGEAH